VLHHSHPSLGRSVLMIDGKGEHAVVARPLQCCNQVAVSAWAKRKQIGDYWFGWLEMYWMRRGRVRAQWKAQER
jgi:hypothetical protein